MKLNTVFKIWTCGLWYVSAVTMFKGFAFVQYERESDARQAVSGEAGNLVKGRILGKLHIVNRILF